MWHLQASLGGRILKSAREEGDTGSAAASVMRKRRKDMKISEDRKQTEDYVSTSIPPSSLFLLPEAADQEKANKGQESQVLYLMD